MKRSTNLTGDDLIIVEGNAMFLISFPSEGKILDVTFKMTYYACKEINIQPIIIYNVKQEINIVQIIIYNINQESYINRIIVFTKKLTSF